MGHDVDEADVAVDGKFPMEHLHLVRRDEERLPQGPRAHDAGCHLPLDRAFGEKDIDFRLVGFFHRRRAIVHLDKQVASCRDDPTDALGVDHGQRARNPSTEEILVGVKAEVPKALVTKVGILCIQRGSRPGDVDAQDGVVRDGVVARHDLQRTDGHVRLKTRRQDEDLVLVRHGAFVHIRRWHGHHEVRISDLAVFREVRQTGIVGRIPLGLSGIDPGAQGFNFLGAQDPFPHKVTVGRIRRPRRHVACGGHELDEFAVGRYLLKGGERHRSDFTHPVTLGAVFVDDGRYVRVVRDALSIDSDAQQEEREEQRKSHGIKLRVLVQANAFDGTADGIRDRV